MGARWAASSCQLHGTWGPNLPPAGEATVCACLKLQQKAQKQEWQGPRLIEGSGTVLCHAATPAERWRRRAL